MNISKPVISGLIAFILLTAPLSSSALRVKDKTLKCDPIGKVSITNKDKTSTILELKEDCGVYVKGKFCDIYEITFKQLKKQKDVKSCADLSF